MDESLSIQEALNKPIILNWESRSNKHLIHFKASKHAQMQGDSHNDYKDFVMNFFF